MSWGLRDESEVPSSFVIESNKSAASIDPDAESKLTSWIETSPPMLELIEQEDGARHIEDKKGSKTDTPIDAVWEFEVKTRLYSPAGVAGKLGSKTKLNKELPGLETITNRFNEMAGTKEPIAKMSKVALGLS